MTVQIASSAYGALAHEAPWPGSEARRDEGDELWNYFGRIQDRDRVGVILHMSKAARSINGL